MVGELQIIFGLNAVVIMLGVLRKLLIFIEQLRRIAPRAAINPVGCVAATLIAIVIRTTATTAIVVVITMVIQGILFLVATFGGSVAGLAKM